MGQAQGVYKSTRFKRQTALGTMASNTGGQVIRRENSLHNQQKETYDSNSEQTSHQQAVSLRHGSKLTNASINGLLSPGTYSDIISSVMRKDFAAVADMTGLSLTIAAGTAPSYTITRAAGSFLTDGVKPGMVVRITAGSVNANNLSKNFLVTSLTATVLTGRSLATADLTFTAEGPIAACTIAVPGKVTYTPATGHTDIWYTIEEWYSDIAQSERNQDVRYGQFAVTMPGSGNAKIAITGNGLLQTTAQTVYFASPTAETSTGVCAAASGNLLVNGVAQAVITDLNYTVNGQISPADGVVGTNTRPNIFRSKVLVTGSFTAYFEDRTLPDLFTNETAFAILQVMTSDSTAAADFIASAMPNVKLTSADVDDPTTGGAKRTYNFTALYYSSGSAAAAGGYATTLMMQDSQAT